MSKTKKQKSRGGIYLSLCTTAVGTFGVVRRLREARAEGDKLRLADAAVSAAAAVTSTALLVRELRRLSRASHDDTTT